MSDIPNEVLQLAERIKPLLAGKGPDLQGAVLVELTSLWLAGHPRSVREHLLAVQFCAVLEMAEINGKILRGNR